MRLMEHVVSVFVCATTGVVPWLVVLLPGGRHERSICLIAFDRINKTELQSVIVWILVREDETNV